MSNQINLNKIDKNVKFNLAQSLIKCYLGSREGLRKLNILRSERNLQGDYAEWLIAELLHLKLADSTIQKSYDATDKNNKKYQIKSRIVDDLNSPTSFDNLNIKEKGFDYLIGVLFSRSFELLQIIKVSYKVVSKNYNRNKDDRFRWNQSTKKILGVEIIYNITEAQTKLKEKNDNFS